jgi:hypothetical protein
MHKTILMVAASIVSTVVLAKPNCSDFLVPGAEYSIVYTTTKGPGEVGRIQRGSITATSTSTEGECKKVTGTFGEAWAMSLKGCESLDIVAKSPGNGDLTGQGTCTATEATGSFGYVDGHSQTFAYTFKIKRIN